MLAILVCTGLSKAAEDSPEEFIAQRFPSTTREPSLQAYGLPKKILINSGKIERVNLNARLAEKPTWGPNVRHRRPYPYQQVQRSLGVLEGSIERSPGTFDPPVFKRSVDNEDLESAETNVFRPLFVYRQQMAERHRIQRSKNPIYGSYQYGPRKPVTDCNNSGKQKRENHRRSRRY